MVGERTIDGFEALTLASEAAGGLEAALVPGAGMVVCSLRHRGEELLGQRGGLRTYVERHSTMGIPLLYPWANRVGEMRFEVAGREVDLKLASPAPATDAAGLPIHGLLSAAGGWRVERHAAHDNGGSLTASFDFGADSGLIGAFPFPHRLRYEADLRGPTLSIATTVHAERESPVPIAFGYHPYLRLPGFARTEWEVRIPVRERMMLNEHLLPTGEREPIEIKAGALGGRTFDDEYVAPGEGRPFILAGGRRRIELELVRGYPFSQVYAPADDEVIAFEPMTAPTNALVRGGPELPILQPGERYEARFRITVADQT
jgi:galactose mutarotase-like enzyme